MGLQETLASIGARLVPESVRDAAWLRPRYPLVGVEIGDDAVVAVRLVRSGSAFRLAGHGRKALPPGSFSASLMAPDAPASADGPAVAAAIADALRLAGAEGAGRISIAVPDTAVRVFVTDIADLPPRRAQAEEMIRFRIRRAVPFRPEESRLSWDVLGRDAEGRMQVLVAIAPETVLRPLETALRARGLRCGLVDLASLDVYHALRLDGRLGPLQGAGANGEAPVDTAVLNATPAFFSLMILRGGQLIFYRSKNYHVQSGYQGEESLRVVGRELRSSLGYYEERLLGQGLSRVLLRVSGVPLEGVLDLVRDAGCAAVEPARLERIVPELAQLPPETALEVLPAVGLALRRQA